MPESNFDASHDLT
jgi:PAS domain-containing protein